MRYYLTDKRGSDLIQVNKDISQQIKTLIRKFHSFCTRYKTKTTFNWIL